MGTGALVMSDPQSQIRESAGTSPPAVVTAVKPKAPARKPRQLPPYKVLLHNDDVNTFEHVILAIMHVTAMQQEAAIEKTLEAHESGVALLLVTHQERAELYVDQFQSVKLTVTIEAA